MSDALCGGDPTEDPDALRWLNDETNLSLGNFVLGAAADAIGAELLMSMAVAAEQASLTITLSFARACVSYTFTHQHSIDASFLMPCSRSRRRRWVHLPLG
jgi:hypothetical protein